MPVRPQLKISPKASVQQNNRAHPYPKTTPGLCVPFCTEPCAVACSERAESYHMRSYYGPTKKTSFLKLISQKNLVLTTKPVPPIKVHRTKPSWWTSHSCNPKWAHEKNLLEKYLSEYVVKRNETKVTRNVKVTESFYWWAWKSAIRLRCARVQVLGYIPY